MVQESGKDFNQWRLVNQVKLWSNQYLFQWPSSGQSFKKPSNFMD